MLFKPWHYIRNFKNFFTFIKTERVSTVSILIRAVLKELTASMPVLLFKGFISLFCSQLMSKEKKSKN